MYTLLLLVAVAPLLIVLFVGVAMLWAVRKCLPENIKINVGLGGSLSGSPNEPLDNKGDR